ncbi:MAG: hypothetical protein AAF849_24100 [Bacteroidota bacterium]
MKKNLLYIFIATATLFAAYLAYKEYDTSQKKEDRINSILNEEKGSCGEEEFGFLLKKIGQKFERVFLDTIPDVRLFAHIKGALPIKALNLDVEGSITPDITTSKGTYILKKTQHPIDSFLGRDLIAQQIALFNLHNLYFIRDESQKCICRTGKWEEYKELYLKINNWDFADKQKEESTSFTDQSTVSKKYDARLYQANITIKIADINRYKIAKIYSLDTNEIVEEQKTIHPVENKIMFGSFLTEGKYYIQLHTYRGRIHETETFDIYTDNQQIEVKCLNT